MNRFTRLAAAATLALLAGATATAPAYASGDEFTWLGCAGQPTVTTGTLTGYDAGTYYMEAWHGSQSGHLYPCRPPVQTDVFAIASYDSDGSATALAARYNPLHDFTAEVDVRLKTVAVCLIDNLKSRLDCIKIGWYEPPTGPAQPLNGGHLPTDSPLVTAAPVVTMNGNVIRPGCPTCVDD